MVSWYNRLLVLLGQPVLGIDLSSEWRYEYPFGVTQVISGHHRLYSLKAIEKFLEHCGLKLISYMGYAQVWSKTKPTEQLELVYHLDKLLQKRATLAANLLIVAKKQNSY